MKKFLSFVVLVTIAFSATACKPKPTQDLKPDLFGQLVVFHAGSLTVPFEKIEKEFELLYPEVDVLRTPGGSAELARKITEFDGAVDVFASADYKVIDSLLIPNHAQWNALFAANSMVIMYSESSKYCDEFNANNWYKIIQREGVNFGHSEPDLDPCGYRSVLLFQLAEKHYKLDGLNEKILQARQEKNIRPKSVELIALLESGSLDYAFEYESVAMQHMAMNPDLKYIKLPDELNLANIEFEDFYAQASIELTGTEPGKTVTRKGEPIVYSLTIPSTVKNQEVAEAFIKFLFDKEFGMKILLEQGQPILDKIIVFGSEHLPPSLQYLK